MIGPRGLLAALGAVMASVPVPTGGRHARLSASENAIERAHQRARDRQYELRRLSWLERLGLLSQEDRFTLHNLRLRRGKLARRMRRGRDRSINVRLRAAAARRTAKKSGAAGGAR